MAQVPPQQDEAPPRPPAQFPVFSTSIPSLQWEGSYIKVLFSALLFLLISSKVRTTGHPTLHPHLCLQVHRVRPEAGQPSPLDMGKLSQGVTKASGRSQDMGRDKGRNREGRVRISERKREEGEQREKERKER